MGTIILSALVAHTAWHWMTERFAALRTGSLAGARRRVPGARAALADGAAGLGADRWRGAAMRQRQDVSIHVRDRNARFPSPILIADGYNAESWGPSLRLAAILHWVAVVIVRATLRRAGAAARSTRRAERSDLGGVYSAAQAERGKKLYGMTVSAAVTTSRRTGRRVQAGTGRATSLEELYETYRRHDARRQPGRADGEERCADIVGYLFKLNGMPAGKEDSRRNGSREGARARFKIELPPDAQVVMVRSGRRIRQWTQEHIAVCREVWADDKRSE